MIRSLDLFENKDVQLPKNIVDHGSSPRFIIVFLIEIAIIRDITFFDLPFVVL